MLQLFLTRKAYKGLQCISFFTFTDRTTHRPDFQDAPGKVQSSGTSESNSDYFGESEKHLPYLQWPMLLTPCDPASPKIHHVSSQRTEKTVSIHLHPLPFFNSPSQSAHKSSGSWNLTRATGAGRSASMGVKQLEQYPDCKSYQWWMEKGDHAALV